MKEFNWGGTIIEKGMQVFKRRDMGRIYITILLLFIGCTNQLIAQVVKVSVPQPVGDNFLDSELFDTVSFTALLPERGAFLRENMEMKIADNNYFILDDQNKQCVYRFDESGAYLNLICEKQMEATQEDMPVLNNAIKFSIDENFHQVEIYNFEDSEIKRFSYDGKKTGVTSIQYSPSDFIRDQDGNYWLYMGWNNGETSYRLIKVDALGAVLDRKMRLVSNCTPTVGFAFYASKNQICFWESLGSTVYGISDDVIAPRYGLNFGHLSLPMNYHTLNGEESIRLITHTGFYSLKKYLENDNFTYFFLNYSSMEQREMLHVIYDKATQRIHILLENAAIGAFDKAQYLTENDELLFLVSPRKIRSTLRESADYLPLAFETISEGLSKYRAPVVLKIKLVSPGY